jgi:hypothetical protein
MPYHLELLKKSHDYNVFSRAHMTYINQIFGDITVRQIIQELYPKVGTYLRVEKSDFHNDHHVLEINGQKICSVERKYQDIDIDINDSLCQSYTLMSYLEIHFDTKPSKLATEKQKYEKQLCMIKMYKKILKNKAFSKAFSKEIVYAANNYLWEDTVNHENAFYLIKKLKTGARIMNNIKKVLNAWEEFGWRYFVGATHK